MNTRSLPAAPAIQDRTSSLRAWVVLVLLGAAGFLFRFDRQVFSVLKTTICSELQLSNTDYSLLIGALMFSFTAGFFPAGHVVDRHGTRATLWLFLIGMSVATVLTGWITSFAGLFAARILLGISDAGIMPAVMVAVTRWFPVERRATAFTVQSALHNCGAILAPPLVAGITLLSGWRAAFLLPGLAGLLLAFMLRTADTAPPFPPVSGENRSGWPDWRGLFRSVPLRRLILARMCGDPLWFFLFHWQSAYLQERLGLSLADLGRWTWIPPAFSVVATLVLGRLNDRLIRAGRPPLRARLSLLGAITVVAPITLLLPWLQHPIAAIAALTLVYGMCNAWLLLTNLVVTDISPAASVGAAFGLMSACGALTSLLFNLVAGPLIDNVGHTLLLTIGAVLHPCAWVIVRRLDRAILPAAPGGERPQAG